MGFPSSSGEAVRFDLRTMIYAGTPFWASTTSDWKTDGTKLQCRCIARMLQRSLDLLVVVGGPSWPLIGRRRPVRSRTA